MNLYNHIDIIDLKTRFALNFCIELLHKSFTKYALACP